MSGVPTLTPCCRGRVALLPLLCAALVLPLRAQSPMDGTRSRRDPDMTQPRLDPLPVFFPPSPPPLGRPLVPAAAPTTNAAPAELAAFVNDPFYPVLGTRLVTKTLTPKLRAQVDAYLATKRTLQDELRAELDRVQMLPAADRGTQLAAFARKQNPQIVALEESAERLRRDLINSENTWSALRQWRLNDGERRGFSPLEIAQVMRGYAYYDNALLPGQRRLLREIFLELAYATDSAETAKEAQPYLFFPPEPARVLLPDNLPAELAAKITAYQTKKSRLKKELYDTIYTQDGKLLGFLRGNALKTLAGKQAASLAELDRFAEEIRGDLARVMEPTAVAERSPLPPVLEQRVAALMARYREVRRDAAERLDAIVRAARDLPLQTSFRFETDGLKFVVIPSRAARGEVPSDVVAQIDAVRARIASVASDYGQALAQLVNDKDAIRTEIIQAMGNASAADRAFASALRVVTARETEDAYRDYRIAVFQPGLSPEQRRLLFDRVVVDFNLPLPGAEVQPTYRSNTW